MEVVGISLAMAANVVTSVGLLCMERARRYKSTIMVVLGNVVFAVIPALILGLELQFISVTLAIGLGMLAPVFSVVFQCGGGGTKRERLYRLAASGITSVACVGMSYVSPPMGDASPENAAIHATVYIGLFISIVFLLVYDRMNNVYLEAFFPGIVGGFTNVTYKAFIEANNVHHPDAPWFLLFTIIFGVVQLVFFNKAIAKYSATPTHAMYMFALLVAATVVSGLTFSQFDDIDRHPLRSVAFLAFLFLAAVGTALIPPEREEAQVTDVEERTSLVVSEPQTQTTEGVPAIFARLSKLKSKRTEVGTVV